MSQPLTTDDRFAITASGVTFRYAGTPVLHNVALEVRHSDCFGLLGPNGSGKTTLFRLLSTLLPLQSGQVLIDGVDLKTAPSNVRQKIGVTFQSPALDPRLTVIQNLRCHGEIYGLARNGIESRARELLQSFRMNDCSNRLAGSLSGGQKRRVELAKGLMHAPSVLLLDEPTSGLDVRARQEFFQILAEHRRKASTTIIIATHLMEEAELCDQLLLLNDGRVVATGSPAELKASIPGDRLTVNCRNKAAVADFCQTQLGIRLHSVSSHELSARLSNAGELVPQLLSQCGAEIESVYVTRPSLEDVFLNLTGSGLTHAETLE